MAAEIKAIVQETLVGKPENEVQTIDKCLRLVGIKGTARERELGYCLLARMIIKSSPNTLRAVQSRLANRLAPISDHFQMCGSLFVRELLIRSPQSGELHSPLVFKIIINCMDAAVQSNDPSIRGLAAELFALRISCQNLVLLLNTLDLLLKTENIKNISPDVLQLSTLGVSSYRTSLITLLFEVLALSLGYSTKPGLLIERKDVIRVIELGIRIPRVRSVAFACLRSLCVNTKHSLIPMIGRIVSTLVSELEKPDVDLMKTLAFISTTFGPVTSTIHKHFYVIFTALKQPLHEQDYGDHAAALLSSIIESSAALIKPEVFVTVQKSVCESAIMHPDCSAYLQLLNAFLSLNNEYVPPPLQVARSVCSRTRSTSQHAHVLRTLCDMASRPRTTDVANVKAKKTLVLKEKKTIESAFDVPEKEDIVFEDDDIIEVDMEEKEDDLIIPIMPSPEPHREEPESSRKKKNSESNSKPVVVKKKKKVVREVKTQLLEGEASCAEILDLFDPS